MPRKIEVRSIFFSSKYRNTYLIAFCHKAKADRTFKVSGIRLPAAPDGLSEKSEAISGLSGWMRRLFKVGYRGKAKDFDVNGSEAFFYKLSVCS